MNYSNYAMNYKLLNKWCVIDVVDGTTVKVFHCHFDRFTIGV